jgi:predicted nucleotidyltransferase
MVMSDVPVAVWLARFGGRRDAATSRRAADYALVYHRARIRATRWLNAPYGPIIKREQLGFANHRRSCYGLFMTPPIDPVLSRFRAELNSAYGARIERVVLFGSRARGDARPDSDYDVAVFLNDLAGFGAEAAKIAAIETDILYDTGAVINALPLRAGSHRERTGLMHEIRRHGRDL